MNHPLGIYPVITGKFCNGRSQVDVLKAVLSGGAKIVQLREKEISKRELLGLAGTFRELTSHAGAIFIMNDHLDIAMAVGADGVHLGQDDLPCSVARELAPDMIIGISTHNATEIKVAEADGATWINIGPIFTTGTKEVGIDPLGIEYLRQSRTSLPFSVMGGIKEHNIRDLLQAGAGTIAMVTEITMAEDIEGTTKRLQQIITSFQA
jgi:thiamine-phosphate pyrophosphorylase